MTWTAIQTTDYSMYDGAMSKINIKQYTAPRPSVELEVVGVFNGGVPLPTELDFTTYDYRLNLFGRHTYLLERPLLNTYVSHNVKAFNVSGNFSGTTRKIVLERQPKTAPTKPTNLNISGVLKAGGAITASWSPSTDAEGDPITYTGRFYWHRGGTAEMSNLWGGTGATTSTATIPNDLTITGVSFYVLASDGTLTSGQVNSAMFPVVNNNAPTVTLNTTNNRTLYENDILTIDGQASDADNGNIVNVKYQIGIGTIRAIATGISNGTTPIPFNEQLTFKNGKLLKGETEITGSLSEGTAHQLKVWSEDDKGGKSGEEIRTFYVVPNRAPAITVDSIANQNDLINSDKLTISGTTTDPDGNDVVVKYKINSGLATQIHSGPAGAWSFELSVKDLVNGENSIIVEVTDTYNFKTSKTIKLNKAANLTPLSESVQRYKIVSPTGSAQGVLLWIQRSEELEVSAEISMTNGSEQERFVPLIRNDEDTNPNPQPAPVSPGFVEDYFKYRADTLAEHIVLKLTLKGNKPITLISGALLQ